MGLLKASAKGEEPDFDNDPSKKEEDYQKLYMKIARDFVHKDDFAAALGIIRDLLSLPIGSGYLEETGAHAKAQALLYKHYLDIGETSSSENDVLILDEDEED